MDRQMQDVMIIRDLIERWAVYRDSLLWDKFRTIWHEDGRMKATWFDGPYEEFIKTTEEGVKHGLNIMHILGGSAIEVKEGRATSLTRFVILQRAMLDGILCDVTTYARHQDLWEKRKSKWGLVSRETICDKDRIDPVNINQKINLDETILGQFPVEYKYLAYLQTKIGYNVDRDVPRLSGGESLIALYERAKNWLLKAR
ncbi:MAG TPA: nuclear transport factor 2 family protein [Syntrophorhabdaceae bacterium]|nr:nuclear transport factor 2 family protein [Syntrophorhabdaceae bacterium]